jgi:DNA-directed RNA polymerase subunit F
MAVKAKAKAKKKQRKEITHAVSEKRVRKLLEETAADADKKFKYAQRILEINPPQLTDTVERMVETLGQSAPNRLKIDGVTVPYDEEELRAINRKLHYWVAVRLLVAAAEWDIRISGFKLPKSKCARCLKKVK